MRVPSVSHERAPSGARLFILLATVLWLGCPTVPSPGPVDAGPGPDTEATSPLASRFLPSKLPWKASENARVGAYPVVLTTTPQQQLTQLEPLWRPVVIDRETVAVVFPPEDRFGFDIAWGGFQKPWQRADLLNLRPLDVGAMDAVVDDTGTVWVAFRPRERNKPLKLVRWRPGEAARVEDVPLPTGQELNRLPYAETCPDVTLGSAPDGSLDLVMRGDPMVWKPQLFHGRRPPGSTAFTWNLIVDGSKTETPAGSSQVWDFGCRNALAYDELGRRVVLSLVRKTSYPFASPLRMNAEAFREGRDGRFWNAGLPVSLTLPDGRENGHRGFFDLHDHPSGFLFAGPSKFIQRKSGEPNGELPWAYFRAYSVLRDPYPFVQQEYEPEDYRFRAPASDYQSTHAPAQGGKLLADGCGNFMYAPVPYFNVTGDWAEEPLQKVCLTDPSPAPVFRSASPPGLETPSFAHGRALPFELGVCIDAERNLHVCHGGHLGTRARGSSDTLQPELGGELARVSATQPAAGARDVDLGTGVTVTFDRPLERSEQSELMLWNLSRAEQEYGKWEWVAGTETTLRFTPNRPLMAGHRYRLVASSRLVSGFFSVDTWKLPEGRHTVVDFETRGDAGLGPDPWKFPFQLQCEQYGTQERGADGVCTVTLDDSAFTAVERSGSLRLFLTGYLAYDYGRTDAGTGWVEELDGGVRPDSGVFPRTNLNYVDIYPGLPLEEERELSIVIPAAFDRLGRQFSDTRVKLQLAHGNIRVVDIQPAAGATGVPTSASIAVRVNRPQSPPQWNSTWFYLTTYAPGSTTEVEAYPQVDLTIEPPSTYRLTPREPLLPGRFHQLKVFSNPPVVSGFTTAP